LIDTWRRKKPEYWLTKKAYSPVRVDDKPLANPGRGKPLKLPVRNWFDHTNLQELTIAWAVGKESGTITGPSIEPHGEGILEIPGRAWVNGDVLNLKFHRMGYILVDEYNLPINPSTPAAPKPKGPAPELRDERDEIIISGPEFSLTFSKKTGLVTKGASLGTNIIESGPHIHLVGMDVGEWSLSRISAMKQADEAVVTLSGSCCLIEVSFEVRVDGEGLITVSYTLDSVPEAKRELDHGIGGDAGGCWEVGISFVLTPEVDRLAWQRKGLWSAYPQDHIARNEGVAHRDGHSLAERYGEVPCWPWSEDERDFPLNGRYDVGGRGTNDFRSMKENIVQAAALLRGTQKGLRAESDGSGAVRLEVLEDPAAIVDDRDRRVKLTGSWTRSNDAESYGRTVSRSSSAGDAAELTFTGAGICWLGTLDPSGGGADVYLDGKLEIAGLSLRDYRTQKGAPVFSREGLDDGPHTLKIVATSEDGSPVSLDAFRILGGETRGRVRLVIDNEWNYPKLGWGNYVKDPIFVESGYTSQVGLRFCANDESAA
jgi:hypothetical protein